MDSVCEFLIGNLDLLQTFYIYDFFSIWNLSPIYIYIRLVILIYSQCEFIKETLNKLLQIKRITLYYKIFIPSAKTILLTVSFSHSNLLTKQTNFQRTFSPFNFHPHFKSKNERINILKNKVSKKKKKIAKHCSLPSSTLRSPG